MSEIKLETMKSVPARLCANGNPNYIAFLETLRDMKVGQSFLWSLSANDRTAIKVASIVLNRSYITRIDGKTYRVWRMA